jgi:hypothetical protein
MTKYTVLLALGVSAFCAPAFAQHSGHMGYGATAPSSDPCVLGTNTQPGACVGPVRVAPVIVSQGSVQVQQQQIYSAAQQVSAVQSYGTTVIAHNQAPVMQASGGCVPNYPTAMAGCNGNWVYAPNGNGGQGGYVQGSNNQGGFVPNGYSQGYVNQGYVNQGYVSGPQYATAPAPVQYQQAPQYYAPAPVQYAPVQQYYAPVPVQYAPAQQYYAPAPVQYAPAQQYYAPAPVQYAPVQYAPAPRYAPQPQPAGYIQPSFFTGGISYGAGFPEGGGYSGGGGGGYIISGGGTRFSGVRERSPTTLIAPPMRQRQPSHAPPPKHCGHC